MIAVHMSSIEDVSSLRFVSRGLSVVLNNSLCPFATTVWLLFICFHLKVNCYCTVLARYMVVLGMVYVAL